MNAVPPHLYSAATPPPNIRCVFYSTVTFCTFDVLPSSTVWTQIVRPEAAAGTVNP